MKNEPFDWEGLDWESFRNLRDESSEEVEWGTEEEKTEWLPEFLNQMEMEIPGAQFLFNSTPRKIKNNFSSDGFEDIIFKNPAYTIGELQFLYWQGEILEDNDA